MSCLLAGLRRIDPLDHARQQAVERWRLAGYRADLHQPSADGVYLEFSVEGQGGGWQGLVEAREWLDGLLPTLRALLKVPCSIERIVGLFQALARPLAIDLDELGYEHLSAVRVSAAPPQPLPRLATPRGALWLSRLPSGSPPAQPLSHYPWLTGLPHSLRTTLGYSRIGSVALHLLAEGDVLRISRVTRQWQLAGQPVGDFTFTEQGLHMTLSVTPIDSPQAELAEPDAVLGSVPVQLEFVLHEQRLDLIELAALIEGRMLLLEASVLRNIEVRVNGRVIACGELVQLGEQLGVELQQIGAGAPG